MKVSLLMLGAAPVSMKAAIEYITVRSVLIVFVILYVQLKNGSASL